MLIFGGVSQCWLCREQRRTIDFMTFATGLRNDKVLFCPCSPQKTPDSAVMHDSDAEWGHEVKGEV